MKVSKQQLFEAIESCDGIATVIARKLGVTQQAVSKRINAHEEFKQAYQDAKDMLLDVAESELIKAVHVGSPWAIKFILSTLGKSRGYSTRVHVQGSMHQIGQVILTLPHNGRDMCGPDGRSQRS